MTLGSSEIRAFYDRFGAKQDTQAFYEDPALDDLVEHASFGDARRVFELGCGTGRFAARLLAGVLPVEASYLGADVSPTMTGLAAERLATWADRACVVRSDGSLGLPVAARSVDRVVATYVLDLLSDADTERFFGEALRVLDENGRLCLLGLTNGTTALSSVVTTIWTTLFRVAPSLVGGCRPVSLERFVDPRRWVVEHRRVVVAFGVPSEVLVVRCRRFR